MNAALITQLIIAIGPAALELIPKLTELWTKPELSLDEVKTLCAPARKSYEEYVLDRTGL